MIDTLGLLRLHYGELTDVSQQTKIHNRAVAGKCIDLHPSDLAIVAFFSGSSQIASNIRFVLNDCNKSNTRWSATWGWDQRTGEIYNLVYSFFAGQRWCMENPQTRVGGVPVVQPCNGSPGQQWTLGQEGIFRNRLTVGGQLAVAPISSEAQPELAVWPPALQTGALSGANWGPGWGWN